MFRDEIDGLGCLLQILQLRPMLQPGTLFALDIHKQPDTIITLLRLPGWAGATGDPGSDCFLYIIDAQRFQTGKPLLIRGSAGYVFAPLDLIPFTL